ncbi:NADH-ubiquinone oxidoreductase chain C [Minicystis rosea]|nr:NADH-ubiquinone oxidoreductase chain C [Minicystis rosea]
MSKKVLEFLQAKFGPAILETHSQFGDDTAVVDPAKWREVAFFLRDDPRLQMNLFVDLCGVDYLTIGADPRFEVVLHLRSIQHAHRIRIKARVGDEAGEGAEIDSVVPVWRGADWFERETFDLMGIVFRGHPDLRRILLYPEFVGHPLRKDYPADKIQPLVPFREDAVGKLPPFDADEGMSFGRQTHDYRREDMRRETQDATGHLLPKANGEA